MPNSRRSGGRSAADAIRSAVDESNPVTVPIDITDRQSLAADPSRIAFAFIHLRDRNANGLPYVGLYK